MSKINRYNGNLKPFAGDSTGTNRTVFNDVTQSDTLDDNLSADFFKGWELVLANESPTKQDFNALGFTYGQLLAYLHQTGVAEYNEFQEYNIGSIANVEGVLYKSKVDLNIGNSPVSDNINWKNILDNNIISTVADLRSMVEIPETVYVTGYSTANDGAFGSHFFKLLVDTGQVDNGGTIIRTVNGVYELQYEGLLHIEWFGAIGNDSVDMAALQGMDVLGGGYISTPNIKVTSNISLVGDYTFSKGGSITVDATFTVTWAGNIYALNEKIFDGSFIVAKVHKLTEIRCTWFGAKSGDLNTDVTDTALANANAKAIREANAMTWLGSPGGIYVTPILRLPDGLVIIDDDDTSGHIIDLHPYATVKGNGWSSVLRPMNGAKAFSVIKCTFDGANNIILDDFMIYGEASAQTLAQTGIEIAPATSPMFYSYFGRGLSIKEMSGNGIKINGAGMDNCTIEPITVRDSTLHNLYVTACDRLIVQNGIYRTAKSGNSGALFDGQGCLSAIIRDNQFDENNTHGLFITNVNGRFKITGNRFQANATGVGLYLDRCSSSQVTGNFVENNGTDGVLMDACVSVQLNDNYARSNGRFGILAGTVSSCQIHNNNVTDNGSNTVNTYDGINIQSNSDNNSIQGNVVRNVSGNQRYGLRIEAADCNTNMVLNNDLLSSGATASISDVGTGTIVTSGNRI
jgi:hypothetical protein